VEQPRAAVCAITAKLACMWCSVQNARRAVLIIALAVVMARAGVVAAHTLARRMGRWRRIHDARATVRAVGAVLAERTKVLLVALLHFAGWPPKPQHECVLMAACSVQ
jgi:predicted DNA repair protein MutK